MHTRLLACLLVGAGCAASPTTPVINVHAHVWFDEAGAHAMRERPATREALLAVANTPGLEALGVVVVATRPGIEATRRLNDQLREVLQRDPRLFGIGSVHPADGQDAIGELERFPALGFKALKLHPNSQQLDLESDAVAAVVRKAGELGLPVLIDFSGALRASDLGPYLLLALKAPDTELILAHMGGTRFQDLLVLSALRPYTWFPDNIWADLSAVAWLHADSPREDELVWVIRRFGVDRVLFGSDFPLRTPQEAIDDVRRLGLTPAEERKVFYENAVKLGFAGGGRR